MAIMSAPRPVRRHPGSRDPRLVALAEESGYEIQSRIGAGGMGIVYRATDADGQDVAIKLLRHEISDDPRARARLAREVGAQRLVRNANIVRILDAELESADAFVVTEFIPGPTLEDAVRDHGGLHPEAVREVGLVLGETLRDIHGAGVIHRDLKPSNVMLRGATDADLMGFDPDGDRLDPVIIDFGIAIAAEESRLTSTGLVMGTAAYLDPEVIRTDHTGEAGDWWAWAALLAFAATGREPFGSGRADLVFLRAERGEIDVEGTPSELAAWLRSALRSNPAERPAPEELLERLAELDLSRYDDPGQTEVLTAGTGAAAGAAATSSADDATQVLPTTTTPSQDSTPTPGPTDQPTEALPHIPEGPGEAPTEALPITRTPEEPATEVLPVTGPPTAVLPVIPDPQPAPMPPQPMPPRQMPAPQQAIPQPPPHIVPAPPQQMYPPPVPAPPRRPGLMWTGHLLLVALGALAPYVALGMMLLLGAISRTWEGGHRAVAGARMRGVTGSGPQWQAGLLSPLRFAWGLVVTALQVILPLLLGLLVGIATDAAWTLLAGAPPPEAVAFGIAIAVTLLITWVGLGSRATRDGAHRMIDAAAPDLLWSAVVLVLLLLLLGAVAFTILARGGAVDYFPFSQLPRLTDIALWRR